MVESLADPGSEVAGPVRPTWLEQGVVITVNSNKGGVGKTTVVLMLAYYLAELLKERKYDFEILLVDWDPQCNLSTCLGFRMDGADGRGPDALYSVDDIITRSTHDVGPGSAASMIEDIRWVVKSGSGNPIRSPNTEEPIPDPINKHIRIIPGHPDMEKRYTLISEDDFYFRLDSALEGVKNGRIVLVDTGPGMGPLALAAWAASDHIFGVAQLYYNEMEGTLKTRNKIHRSRRMLQRPELDMSCVVVNEYQATRVTQTKNLRQITEALEPVQVWVDAAIPEVEQIASVIDQGKSFGRLVGSVSDKNKIRNAGRRLAAKVLEVIGGAK